MYAWDEPGSPEDVRPDPREDAREERWARFEGECMDFAQAEGWPAVLRAVSRAMARQQELFP